MNERTRFLATLLGDERDRFPFFDLPPSEETLERWQREGLPVGQTPAEAFGLEAHHALGLNLRSSPRFVGAPEVLANPRTFSKHYNPDDPTRYEAGYVERCRSRSREGRVVFVDAWAGGFLQMLGVGDWASLEAGCCALLDQPAMVEGLLDRITDCYCSCLEKVLSKVPVDYATLYEPIAANTGPVISPAQFEKFALPGYRKVLSLLKRHGVPLRILCTTGGNLMPLLAPLLEAGINGLWISSMKMAGMDYFAVRRAFGPDLALLGGIDAGALALDDGAVQRAVEETAPGLLEMGRYLPFLDDRPRSNIPFKRYQRYRRLLEALAARELQGKTEERKG